MTDELPFIDEHAVALAVPREQAWDAVERTVQRTLLAKEGGVLRTVLGVDPPAGFGVVGRTPPERLELAGRHRFSRFRLVFAVDEAGAGSRVRALTYAVFPGVRGQVYKTLVIRSRGHVLATRHLLGMIRRRATG